MIHQHELSVIIDSWVAEVVSAMVIFKIIIAALVAAPDADRFTIKLRTLPRLPIIIISAFWTRYHSGISSSM